MITAETRTRLYRLFIILMLLGVVGGMAYSVASGRSISLPKGAADRR